MVDKGALHRWSGWPGAWCLDCGIEDPTEVCITTNPKCLCILAGPLLPCTVKCTLCLFSGEGHFDSYKAVIDQK